MVHRSGGDARHLVGWVQRPPDRRPAPARAAGDHHALLNPRRYSDDVHYKGGLVLGLDMLHWATYMLLANAEPPDPR